MKESLNEIYWPLRITYGLVPVVAGLDKYTGLLADWESYVSPAVAGFLPVGPGTFLGLVGVIEIVVGITILAGAVRLGALVAATWLVLIALNLGLAGTLDVAVRDLVMAVGAWTLAAVAAVRGEALLPQGHTARIPMTSRPSSQ